MNALATTTQGHTTTLDVDIPLHAYTDSDNDVAELVGRLLNEISGFDHQSSHADILQALAITTAIRAAMSDAAAKTGVDISLELLDVEVVSDYEEVTYTS